MRVIMCVHLGAALHGRSSCRSRGPQGVAGCAAGGPDTHNRPVCRRDRCCRRGPARSRRLLGCSKRDSRAVGVQQRCWGAAGLLGCSRAVLGSSRAIGVQQTAGLLGCSRSSVWGLGGDAPWGQGTDKLCSLGRVTMRGGCGCVFAPRQLANSLGL